MGHLSWFVRAIRPGFTTGTPNAGLKPKVIGPGCLKTGTNGPSRGGAGQLGPGLNICPGWSHQPGQMSFLFFFFLQGLGFRVGLWCFLLFSVLFSFHIRNALHILCFIFIHIRSKLHILCFIFISKKLYITHNLLSSYIYTSFHILFDYIGGD